MKRRPVLAVAAAFALGARAQSGRPMRIGWLSHHDRVAGQLPIDTFTRHMRARGWEAQRDFVLEVRWADRSLERLAELAAELAALRPHLLVAPASTAATALRKATTTIPIVGFGLTQPVELGLVQSLARPGGNLTGNLFNSPEFAGKVLEALKAAAPRVQRVLVIHNPQFPGMPAYLEATQRSALALGVELQWLPVAKPEEFRLRDVEQAAIDGMYVAVDYATHPLVPALVAHAVARKMPSVGTNRTFVAGGGLMALDADPDEMFSVAADYAVRILMGANPATLPVQAPTRYQLLLNRRAAEAIRLTLSQELLLRASEVIS